MGRSLLEGRPFHCYSAREGHTMTDETVSVVTVSVNVSQVHKYTLADDEVPDGQYPQDVAFARAVEDIRGELLDWPGAFVHIEDIEYE